MTASILPTEIGPDTPLRLAEAVKIAFPAGGMTVSGLRREIARGRLVFEVIAGKQFTTLENIAGMRSKCRVQAKVLDSTSSRKADTATGESKIGPHGSSETAARASSQAALRSKLNRQSSA